AGAEGGVRVAAVADARRLVLVDVLVAVDVLWGQGVVAVEEQAAAVWEGARLVAGGGQLVRRPAGDVRCQPGRAWPHSVTPDEPGLFAVFHAHRPRPRRIARRALEPLPFCVIHIHLLVGVASAGVVVLIPRQAPLRHERQPAAVGGDSGRQADE